MQRSIPRGFKYAVLFLKPCFAELELGKGGLFTGCEETAHATGFEDPSQCSLLGNRTFDTNGEVHIA